MRHLLISLAVIAVAGALAFPAAAQVDERRWEVRTSDGRIVGLTDDYSLAAPYGDGTVFVLDSIIRAANPPGLTGAIYQGATWDGTNYSYTPPAGAVLPIDPTTDIGSVQAACDDMLDTFEAAFDYIQDNRIAWQNEARKKAVTGMHWMIVNAARVALNSTRTHATRAKFCDESASWPTGLSGDVVQFVDAMGDDTVTTPTKDWSWVNPTTNARNDVADAAQGFNAATDVETAPGSDKLIGRQWVRDIP